MSTYSSILVLVGYIHIFFINRAIVIGFSADNHNLLITNDSTTTTSTVLNVFSKKPFSNNNGTTTTTTKDIIKKVLAKKCSYDYSSACFKMDVAKFVNRLGSRTHYQLLPGISLIRSSTNTNSDQLSDDDMPTEVAMSVVRNNENSSFNELDDYLYTKMDAYLNSLSVKVNLLQNPLVNGLKTIGGKLIWNLLVPSSSASTGRGKKGGHKDMSAALWSAATMGALGFAGLAAMSGKALMTATVALILSIMCMLKGCGGNGKSSHYEIITKPANLHDVDHVHSLSGSPYGYARHFVEETVVPTLNLFDSGEIGSGESRNVEAKVVPLRTVRLQQPARIADVGSDVVVHNESDDHRFIVNY